MNDDSYMMYTRIINSIQYICFICVCVCMFFSGEIRDFFFVSLEKKKFQKEILTIRTKTNLFWKIKINQHLLFCIEFELILSSILHVFVCFFQLKKTNTNQIRRLRLQDRNSIIVFFLLFCWSHHHHHDHHQWSKTFFLVNTHTHTHTTHENSKKARKQW